MAQRCATSCSFCQIATTAANAQRYSWQISYQTIHMNKNRLCNFHLPIHTDFFMLYDFLMVWQPETRYVILNFNNFDSDFNTFWKIHFLRFFHPNIRLYSIKGTKFQITNFPPLIFNLSIYRLILRFILSI